MKQDFQGTRWRKSTYSTGDGECIEIAEGFTEIVPVRDSKDPHGPALTFTADAWRAFITAIHAGEL
ncbi:DUF397 domain-containing protein [Streptomyces sp. CB01881]|uniref:DUF397 domain-containing protein n=1 Tax=Streptomyces sp. CB01881 TaxID=2078691 RepID=UPI000CDC8C1E|nr:DUF397 domain-containing protein [Streptomyces sp. CB01881]AUY52229.1 DUF397 domain-containing protein [Streptomyces sp. CB01881]TYC71654.1 DUF397 domain-containing protein [Streptomyces sp. CB01881]